VNRFVNRSTAPMKPKPAGDKSEQAFFESPEAAAGKARGHLRGAVLQAVAPRHGPHPRHGEPRADHAGGQPGHLQAAQCRPPDLYAVNEDRTAIISKVKTGLNSSRDLKLPISPQSLAGYAAFSRQAAQPGRCLRR
jgi:hypothetical protein